MGRNYKINYPYDFSVKNPSKFYEGGHFLEKESGQDYDVDLKREGQEINESSKDLTIYNKYGVIGGRHFLRRLNRDESSHSHNKAHPRAFSEPFRFVYKDDNSSNVSFDDYKGQACMGVREYENLDIRDQLTERYNNVRLISFQGDLLFCGECVSVDSKNARVHFGRYDEKEDAFFVLEKFSEEIDKGKVGDVERGSPDFFKHDGELFVAYRTVNRTKQENFITVYKVDKQDYTKWEKVNKFQIEGTYKPSTSQHWSGHEKSPTYFDRFRLRVASDGDSIVLVFMASKHKPGADNVINDEKDIIDVRSYVSYDDAITFETKQESYRNFKERENQSEKSEEFIIGEVSSSFSDLFVPFAYGKNDNDSSKKIDQEQYMLNVNFDMYYDENMASFVVVKAGDPYGYHLEDVSGQDFNIRNADGLYPNSYLMMARTSDESLHDWELCCEYPVDYEATGITNNASAQGLYDSDSRETTPDSKHHQYNIHNVEVIPGESFNQLCLWVEEPVADSDGFQTAGVCVSEFCYVHDTQIGQGMENEIDIHYGSKYHDDWWFVSSIINLEIGGVVSTGNRFDYKDDNNFQGYQDFYKKELERRKEFDVYDVYMAGCKWKNRPVVITKRENRGGFLTFYKPYSNLAENYPYEFNHFAGFASLSEVGGNVLTSGNTSSHSYINTPGGANDLFETDHGDNSYVEFNGKVDSPGFPLEREGYRFKVKFGFEVDDLSPDHARYDICQVDFSKKSKSEGRYPRLVVDDQGTGDWVLNAYELDSSGNHVKLGNVIPNADFSTGTQYDVVFAFCNTNYGPTTFHFSVYWKKSSDDNWNRGYNGRSSTNLSHNSSLSRDAKVRFGAITSPHTGVGSSSDTMRAQIFDVFMGNFFEGYRDIYIEEGVSYNSKGTPTVGKLDQSNLDEPYWPKEVEAYDHEVEIDGTDLLDFEGGVVQQGSSDFIYKQGISRNNPKNIFNGFADVGYDFSKQTDKLTLDLKNEDNNSYLSCLSVANISGVHQVELDYDGGTSNKVFDVGYDVLDVDSADVGGQYLILNNQNYEKDELKGRTIFVYNTSTDSYEQCVLVKENFENVVAIDQSFAYSSDLEYRLMNESLFETFNRINLDNYSNNDVSLIFHSLDDTKVSYTPLRYIGEVSLGKVVEFGGVLSEVEQQDISESDVEENDFGLTFPELDRGGLFHSSLSMTFPDLTKRGGGQPRIHNILLELSDSDIGFPIKVEHHDGKQDFHYGVIGSNLSLSRGSYDKVGIDVEVLLQEWEQKSTTEIEDQAPKDVIVTIDKNRVKTGESVSFDVSARDPEGKTLSYEWDFQDGNTSTQKSTTHSFSSEGVYEVVCKVSDPANNTTKGKTKIYVGQEYIDKYEDSLPQYSYTLGDDIDLDVIAKDIDDNKVAFDSAMRLVVSSDSDGDVVYDRDKDGSYGTGILERINRLYQGDLSYRFKKKKGTGIGDVTFDLVDEFGRTKQFTITFGESVTISATNTSVQTSSESAGLVVDRGLEANNTTVQTTSESAGLVVDRGLEANNTTVQTTSESAGLVVDRGLEANNTTAQTTSESAILTVDENDIPTASFTYSPSNPDEWDTISVDGSGSSDNDGIDTYDWFITDPDGNTNSNYSGGSSHSFAPDDYGYWDIELTVTDPYGASDSSSTTVYVNGIPNASFTYSPSYPDEGDTISTDGSGSSDPDGHIDTYDWFITDPDGNTNYNYSAGSTYSFTADKSGYWDIELTVEDNDGARSSTTTTVQVDAVNSAPDASLTYSPSSPDENDSVTLDGSGSSDPDGSISTYDYYVTDPDGNTASATSAGTSTEYTVDDYGYWDFKLTVTDNDGATDSVTHTQYVNGLPTADFSWSPSNPDEDASVQLDGTLSSDPEDSTSDLSYDWTITDPFGNTGTATGSSYSFTPGEGGDWDVQLTVTDTNGNTDSKTQIIDVNHNPVADFSYTPSQPAEGDSVSIDATSSSDVEDSTSSLTYDYYITDPDGNTSSTLSGGTSHSFTADDYGDWDIQVDVEDTDGGVDSKTVTQHVDAYPVSQFSGPTSVAVGNTEAYDGRESNGYSYDPDGSIDSYYWSMETTPDGAEYTIHSPNTGLTDITFNSKGEYVLVLEVTDNDGYTDEENLTIGVS